MDSDLDSYLNQTVFKLEGFSSLDFEESIGAEKIGTIGNRIVKSRSRGDFFAVDYLEGMNTDTFSLRQELSADEKIQRIKDAGTLRSIDSFAVPELIDVSGRNVEMEFIDGENLRDALKESCERAENLGVKFGENLNKAHKEDMAFREFNYGNFLVENHQVYGEEIYYVDRETFTSDATLLDKFADVFFLVNRSQDFNSPDNYQSFLEGFEEGYGINYLETGLSLGVGSALYLIMGDKEKSRRNLGNLGEKLKSV